MLQSNVSASVTKGREGNKEQLNKYETGQCLFMIKNRPRHKIPTKIIYKRPQKYIKLDTEYVDQLKRGFKNEQSKNNGLIHYRIKGWLALSLFFFNRKKV